MVQVQQPRKYLLLGVASPLLRFLGWGLVVLGVAVLAIGFAWETVMPGPLYADSPTAMSYVTLLVGGAALVACGFAMVLVGEIIRVIVDIARQTAPIPQMEESAALVLSVLHRMSSQAPAVPKPPTTDKRLASESSFPIQPGLPKVSTRLNPDLRAANLRKSENI